MKKIIFSLIIIATIISGCTSDKEKAAERPLVSGIETKIINKSSVDDFYETSATVKSKTNSVISSMIMGRVTSLRVKEGDRVKAGQLLLTIESRDTAQKALGVQAGVNEAMKGAEAADQNRKLVNKTYQRYENLYKENVMTKQEFDQISTQKQIAALEYQKAMHGVAQARAGLAMMFGAVVATILTLIIVPILYYEVFRDKGE